LTPFTLLYACARRTCHFTLRTAAGTWTDLIMTKVSLAVIIHHERTPNANLMGTRCAVANMVANDDDEYVCLLGDDHVDEHYCRFASPERPSPASPFPFTVAIAPYMSLARYEYFRA
jgi:hypothetical protein